MCGEILTRPAPISNGKYVKEFETRFADSISVDNAVAVGSGTDALETALRTVGVQGKKVVISDNTMIADALAVERAGGEITLCDIENESFALDPENLDNILKKGDVGAVVLTHVGGSVSKYIEALVETCEWRNIPLIEDAAQAHGARYGNYRAGSIGALACFSFSATKVMTCAEGGMVTTNRVDYIDTLRSLRDFGSPPGNAHLHTIVGGNFKMTEFQAALGLTELDRVRGRIRRRGELGKYYCRHLDDDKYTCVDMGDSSYYKQIVLTEMNRDSLKHQCKLQGVGMTGEVYPIGIHKQPIYASSEEYPITEWFTASHVCPPNYPELTDEEVKYVCEVMNGVEM